MINIFIVFAIERFQFFIVFYSLTLTLKAALKISVNFSKLKHKNRNYHKVQSAIKLMIYNARCVKSSGMK